MAEIALTQGFMALVDDADAAWLGQWRWRYKQHSPRYQGYAVRTTRLAGSPRQVTIYMHRVVFGGDSSEVDHVNRNKLDNRRSNLRAATRAQNAANRACPSGSSPYK